MCAFPCDDSSTGPVIQPPHQLHPQAEFSLESGPSNLLGWVRKLEDALYAVATERIVDNRQLAKLRKQLRD
jgi:hypothetical protein